MGPCKAAISDHRMCHIEKVKRRECIRDIIGEASMISNSKSAGWWAVNE